jgi:hypothetical protein
MNRLFAWGLPDEEEAAPETRTFTDPRHPGEAFTLCLVRPGLLEEGSIAEVAEAYSVEFLAAEATRGAPARAAKPFTAPGGKRYSLNRGAIWEVSAVYCLQGGPAADRYPWTDLLGIYLKRGRLWRQASAWAGELLEAERESLGKPAEEEAEASGASSSAPSPTTTSPTPKSSPGRTASSATSPTASAA